MRAEVRADYEAALKSVQGDDAFAVRFERFFTELRDPLVGAGEGAGGRSFTLGGLPARQCVHELPRFVTVKGGQYFFLPGIEALRTLTVPV